MRYYALPTPDCLHEAERNGFKQEIQDLARKIEIGQSISNWDRFLRTPYVKKALGTFRVVAEERPVGDDVVICLRHVLARGSSAYARFTEDPGSIGRSPSDTELLAWLAERKTVAPSRLPDASDRELGYLYAVQRDDYDDFVFETAEWVERIARLDSRAIPWLHNLLIDRVLTEGSAEPTIAVANQPAVLFRRFPHLRRTILIAPLFGSTLSDEAELRRRFASLLQGEEFTDALLRQRSRRAYPSVVLADQELWLSIQSDELSNLALSPEETAILASVDGSDANAPCYPLFINGRPGSGKSTILKYLFAEQLAHHLSLPITDRAAAPPIYLTYSERLLQDAVETVRRLLRSNADLRLAGRQPNPAADPIAGAFALFHEYLRGLLPSETGADFAPQTRMTFPDFQRQWVRRALASSQTRSLSPELVWHVLRTYIKGMKDSEGNYFDPDAYGELPAKRRTVSSETYRRVYEEVWQGWYGEMWEAGDWWDDQDLARAVLDQPNLDLARHPAVFCDEAQDFTRNELELIARLSLFSRRVMSPQDLRRIPFAFAGDPFQTLNPTGFQWSSVQAGFYEQIVRELDRLGRAKLTFNFKELSFNYRSTKPIVGFVNLVQALRGVLFDIGTLYPQHSWQDESAAVPAMFSSDDPAVFEHIRSHEELVIILPCQEGMEAEFVAADPLLSKLSAGQPRNFLSPMTAKGLEFSRVVLYKFGAECDERYSALLRPLSDGGSHAESPEEALPLEYFVNRLFVAASRPKRALFIVDTPASLDHFWKAEGLLDPELLLRRLPRAEKNGWTRADLTSPQPGFEESWSQDRDDPGVLARQFMETGVASKNSYLLSLAAANFRRAGDSHSADQCLALQLEFSDDFEKAGDMYLHLGRRSDALRCLWQGNKQECYEAIARNFAGEDRVEVRAAEFMARKATSPSDAVAFLDYLDAELATERASRIVADARWREVTNTLVDRIAKANADLKEPAVVLAKLDRIEAAGVPFTRPVGLADVAFHAGRFALAASIWDGTSKKPPEEPKYWKAKAMAEPYPNCLGYFSKLNDSAGIVRAVEANHTIILDRDHARIACAAYVAERNTRAAIALAEDVGMAESLLPGVVTEAARTGDPTGAAQAAAELVRVLSRLNQWARAVETWASFPGDREDRIAIARHIVSQAAGSITPAAATPRVVGFLQTYVQGELAWNDARVVLCGAALERSGSHVESLTFYEAVWKHRRTPASPKVIEQCHVRWCRCKYRLAERYVSQARKADAERQRLEADSELLHLGMSITQVPDYPILPRDTTSAADGAANGTDRASRDAVIDLARMGGSWTPARIAAALRVPLNEVADILGSLSDISGDPSSADGR